MTENTADSKQDEALAIYVASRASIPERGAMWRRFREQGVAITSSWIDEDGEGQTGDFGELWLRIANEIRDAAALVLYAESGDFPLKGAFIEAGIALGMAKPVIVCLPDLGVLPRNYRPIGSWIAHPLVTRCDSANAAIRLAQQPAIVNAIRSRASVPAVEDDALVDEVHRRMDQVAEAAVEWHQAGREGTEWFDAAEKLGAAIDSLLELRSKPETEHERLRRTFAYERVRFHHDPDHVYLVTNVTDDCMLELEGMAGEFAPSLFKRVGNKDTTPFVRAAVPETPVGGEPQKCVKCGHSNFNRVQGECDEPNAENIFCGCKCEFAAPVAAGADNEGDAEREFLAASVAVWREIDRLTVLPEGYKGLPPETDSRKRELAAWENYRVVLDAAALRSGEGEGK